MNNREREWPGQVPRCTTILQIRAGEAVMNYGVMESLRTPMPPHPDGNTEILACPTCGSGEYLYNEDGNRNRYCGQCGQRIDWTNEEE